MAYRLTRDGDYAEKIIHCGLPGDQFVSGSWANYAPRSAADAVFGASGMREGEGEDGLSAPIGGAWGLSISSAVSNVRMCH